MVAALVALWLHAFRIPPLPAPAAPPPPEGQAALTLFAHELTLRNGDNLDSLLSRAGLPAEEKASITGAIREVFDVRKLRAGASLTLLWSSSGSLQALHYLIDADRVLRLGRKGQSYEAEIVEVPGEEKLVTICGSLQGSLFESLEQAAQAPQLALQMAEIFAWDVDFYTDPREGDPFCLVVESKEYANGAPPTYRRILAARYANAGQTYEAFLFPDADGKAQYFSRDGRSLRADFLRSPLKFEARVSSRFSHSRLHPILKIRRPHLGTDYAAPEGAPVQAVASGQVIFAGYSGGGGNTVKLRHAGGYESIYMHLSRIHVRTGQKVEQGQLIGAVGSTGLATGPHLDFRFNKGGKFLDFERVRPPRRTQLAEAAKKKFEAERDRLIALMDTDPDRQQRAGNGGTVPCCGATH